MQYHPDVNKQAGAEEKFKEISNAYEVQLKLLIKILVNGYCTVGDEPLPSRLDHQSAAPVFVPHKHPTCSVQVHTAL